MCPSRKSFNPNQNVNAELEYIVKKRRARYMPISVDWDWPRLCDSFTQDVYFSDRDCCAPSENTVRMQLNASADIEACFSSALSILCCILIERGTSRLKQMTMNRIDELVASVRAHEYLNATMNAATTRASDWNRTPSFSDTLCWIVLDSTVIVFVTVPVETSSSLLIGWANRDCMYSSRKPAEMRRPTTRKQSYTSWAFISVTQDKYRLTIAI